MSLWVDKYRPSALSRLDFHREQAAQLRSLVRSQTVPFRTQFCGLALQGSWRGVNDVRWSGVPRAGRGRGRYS